MNSKVFIVVAAVAFLGCFTGQSEAGILDYFNSEIPHVTCSTREIANMFSCMLSYAGGELRGGSANFLNFINMMRYTTCNPDYLDCASVVRTQQCLAGMPASDASDTCKAEMREISDYQFGLIGYPCRTADFETLCAAELAANGIGQ